MESPIISLPSSTPSVSPEQARVAPQNAPDAAQGHNLLRFPGALLWLAGLVFTLARIGVPAAASAAAFGQFAAAGLGAFACLWAVRAAGARWDARVRTAWIFIGTSALMGACGNAIYALNASKSAAVSISIADFGWILQQPLLWIGLFLLAWRGRNLGMLRLLAETLVVVVAIAILVWSLVLEKRLATSNYSALQKGVALYYPIFDIAHLFCASMLFAPGRDRSGLQRNAGWLFAGVLFLVSSDLFSSFMLPSERKLPAVWPDIFHIWGYLFIGVASLFHARTATREESHRLLDGDDEAEIDPATGEPLDLGDAPPEAAAAFRPGLHLLRWHRAVMLWLPYLATLGVAAVLVGQEMRRANSDSVQRILPVLALLLGIVALQMLSMWENLRLAAKLRASNSTLERSVGDRTRHLATLHGITSTLNTSLDRRTVLRVTLQKTIAAVGAEGGGIWLRDARRDVYTESAPGDEWTLVHWQGLEDDAATISLLRDLSIADAERQTGPSNFHLSPATRDAIQSGIAPPERRLICVPVRWQGTLMGVMGLMRREGSFSYEDRALVESVTLEAGTALQNARLYSEAAHRADRDSVTELFNHRSIQEQLVSTLARCKRTGSQFSIVMMDLNNFKFFNDTYGHPVGDDVLRAVARGLKESCRASDVLGRYGGDEFIIVLPDTDAPGTIDVCQRVKAELDARHFEPVPGTKLPISIAFGWAAYPGDGDSIHELLTQADANLYSHKRGGASYLSQSAKAARETREELKRLKSRAFGGSFGVLDALVTAIDNKDHYTRHHSEEVTYLSLLVAKEIGYDAVALRADRISGLLHDVGKIAVPDDILRHPGKLGREEWEIMQQHPVFGALIVKDVPNLEHVLEGIRHHHEKWDGSGYPDKLAGDAIPEMGRLLALADCYSALTTDRPYRKGWQPYDALEEIGRCTGTQFDPRICAVFLSVMRRELIKEADFADYGTRIAESFGDEAIAASAPTEGETERIDSDQKRPQESDTAIKLEAALP